MGNTLPFESDNVSFDAYVLFAITRHDRHGRNFMSPMRLYIPIRLIDMDSLLFFFGGDYDYLDGSGLDVLRLV